MSRTYSKTPILGNFGAAGQEFFFPETDNVVGNTRIHVYPAQWDDLENLEGQMPQLFIRGGSVFPDVTAKVSADGLPVEDDILDALSRFCEFETRHPGRGVVQTGHSVECLMERWLTAFHGMTEVTFNRWHGYSQGDWGWMLKGFTPEWLEAAGHPADYKRTVDEPANLTDWLRSDFWYSEPQIRRSWTKTYDDGEEVNGEDWETPEDEGPVVIYGDQWTLFSLDSTKRYDPNTHWEIKEDDEAGHTFVSSK